MENDEQVDSQATVNETNSKVSSMNHATINKFLSQTYQMIDQCDPSIATWSSSGDSFIIKDVDAFGKTVLPRYFKHSKFSSFIRQLNFYSFRKLRVVQNMEHYDPVANGYYNNYQHPIVHSKKSVRFMHPYFQRGRPELLQRIQRSTKSLDSPSVEMIKSLRNDVVQMNHQLDDLSSHVDNKLADLTNAVEKDFQVRMQSLAALYQALSNVVAPQHHVVVPSFVSTNTAPSHSSFLSSASNIGNSRMSNSSPPPQPTAVTPTRLRNTSIPTLSSMAPTVPQGSVSDNDHRLNYGSVSIDDNSSDATAKVYEGRQTQTPPPFAASTQMAAAAGARATSPHSTTRAATPSDPSTPHATVPSPNNETTPKLPLENAAAISPLMTLSGVAALFCSQDNVRGDNSASPSSVANAPSVEEP